MMSINSNTSSAAAMSLLKHYKPLELYSYRTEELYASRPIEL